MSGGLFEFLILRYKISLNVSRNCILLPKLFWPTVRKNCSGDQEKLLKFEAEGQKLAKNLEQLEFKLEKNIGV